MDSLRDVGGAAPRLVGSGLGQSGREMLTFIDGEFTQPGPWSLDGAAALGARLRDLHQATRHSARLRMRTGSPDGRDLGRPNKVIGHCEVAPWNVVARDGLPIALIDWETAGPVYPLVELARLCWLDAKLHDDIVAEREYLPPAADRARSSPRSWTATAWPPASATASSIRSSSSPSATPPGKPTTLPSPPTRPHIP
jgi:hypothetical protein